MQLITLSTVTPVYRGAETLRALVAELDQYRKELITAQGPLRLVESIFVDDGSADGSSSVLEELKEEFDWIHVITLSRNYGQHPATVAGILYSSGDWVATLDEDLQHHPKFLNELLQKAITESSDIVYANPIHPVHESAFRDTSSRRIKWIVAKLAKNKFLPLFNSFRMIRGNIARGASAVSIDQTYFDIALSWFTTRISGVKLPLKDLRYVQSKQSGYSLLSLLSHARRLLLTSNVKFVRVGAATGLIVMTLAIFGGITTFAIRLMFPELIAAQGWASVIIVTLFLGGLNAFLVGLVLENLSIILMQTHGKPKFFEVDRTSDKILAQWFKTRKGL
jgi:polyisoprenyl-phosphate glycosyltransferase